MTALCNRKVGKTDSLSQKRKIARSILGSACLRAAVGGRDWGCLLALPKKWQNKGILESAKIEHGIFGRAKKNEEKPDGGQKRTRNFQTRASVVSGEGLTDWQCVWSSIRREATKVQNDARTRGENTLIHTEAIRGDLGENEL